MKPKRVTKRKPRYTSRGFREFGTFPGRSGMSAVVRESSLAGEGPHVWIFLKNDGTGGLDGDDAIQLSANQASELAGALIEFIAYAAKKAKP